MERYYILDTAGQPVHADLMTWAHWFEDTENRIVASTYIGDVHISTVFLGLDHSFGDGPPVLWETMVFHLADGDELQERYTSREAALAGHAQYVADVENGVLT